MRRGTAASIRCTPTRCAKRSTSRGAGASMRWSSPSIAVTGKRCPGLRGLCASSPPSPRWRSCRGTTARPPKRCCASARILARLVPALGEPPEPPPPEETRLFFEAVARLAPALSTVRGLARHLRVRPSTLMSRFHRAGIPSPKSYLAGMRLLHASFLFQNPGLSVSDVAYRMDYSSPQSFGRHLRAVLGVTAGEFRRRFPFEVALARYIDLLIIPYREALRAFHPFNAGSWDQGPSAAAVSRSASAFRV